MLSGALANIGAYGLLRFGGEVLPAELALGSGALAVIGSVSVLYGSAQALSRRTAGEVLAYSAIGQAGYILIALAIGGAVGLAAAVLYAVINSLNKTLLFLAAGTRGWLVGAAFALGALSVAGVPPTAGFFGKLELFGAAVNEGSAALVALLVLGGALSFVYMFQIYQHDFWRPPDADDEDREPVAAHSPLRVRLPVVAAALVVLALGVWPEPLLAVSEHAAAALTAEAGE
jgi:multicomponent Na+:H+ antiporter subunit D